MDEALIKRPKIREHPHKDTMGTPPLMAVKVYGRQTCARLARLAGISTKTAPLHISMRAVKIVLDKWPGFIPAWEDYNNEKWRGDVWFAGRIDHSSSTKGKLQQWAYDYVDVFGADPAPIVDWAEFTSLCDDAYADFIPTQMIHLYVLPVSRMPVHVGPYLIHKIGHTVSVLNNKGNRYAELCSRMEREGLYPHPGGYRLTHLIGADPELVEKVESTCHLKMADSGRRLPIYGKETFEIGEEEAIRIFWATLGAFKIV